MNLIVIAVIVLIIVLISREPNPDRKNRRSKRHDQNPRDAARIESLNHRVSVLEEVLLDRERRLRDKFGEL